MLLLWTVQSTAQDNLVPNGSFEEYSSYPSNPGQFGRIDYWNGLHGTPDFFHRCGELDISIPENYCGIQEPTTLEDSAYVGTSTFTTWFEGGQESF
ncbi:MAG: hypothetical protein ACI9YU_000359 [Flavobacteriales bacterium]|jgi:hypothetical protein